MTPGMVIHLWPSVKTEPLYGGPVDGGGSRPFHSTPGDLGHSCYRIGEPKGTTNMNDGTADGGRSRDHAAVKQTKEEHMVGKVESSHQRTINCGLQKTEIVVATKTAGGKGD